MTVADLDPRAILLDAGNTLLFVDPRRMLDIFADVGGVRADRETFREAEYRARLTLAGAVRDGEKGTESHVWRNYFVTLFRECGVPPERLEPVGERVKEVHDADHLWTHVEEGTQETLAQLREAGHRLAVVSNADGRVEGLLEGAGLRDYFEFVVDSHEDGVEKPDPEIFRVALDRLEVRPSEALYVGDLFPVDVVGARRAGLRTVLLDPLGRQEVDAERIPSVRDLPAYLGLDPGS
jgi:putative hydrolase of the HAD superfamily